MTKIGKKLAAVLLAVVMVVTFVPVLGTQTVYADSVIISGDYAYTVLDDGSAQIIGYSGTDSNVEYPSMMDGRKVTRVGWENNNYQLCPDYVTSIKLPDTVESIGDYAFGNSESLQSIAFGTGLKIIEGDAFKDCTGLKAVEIPSGVIKIGDSAFSGCSHMTSVVIPSGVPEIGSGIFSACVSLKSVKIGKNSEIGMAMFADCSSLTSINIPEGTKYIFSSAFSSCTSLASVTIPSSVTEIGMDAFKETNLTSVTIPGKSVYISDWAFGDCKELKKYTINDAYNIADKALGYYKNSDGKAVQVLGVTIYGHAGNYAEGYAKKHSIKFVDINAAETINKAANPLTIRPKTVVIKYKKLKKKAQMLAVTKVIKFTKKTSDKKTYMLLSARKGSKSFKKYFKINKITGKVTVKKGLKKGTYNVKVKVKALGNRNYKASAVKTITFKVKVK